MKIFANVVKILTALAAVAGTIYVIATYGEQIVAWAKKTLASFPCPKCQEEVAVEEVAVEETPAEEAPAAEEVPVVEVPAEEVPVEDAPAEESEPVAEETDFEA